MVQCTTRLSLVFWTHLEILSSNYGNIACRFLFCFLNSVYSTRFVNSNIIRSCAPATIISSLRIFHINYLLLQKLILTVLSALLATAANIACRFYF